MQLAALRRAMVATEWLWTAALVPAAFAASRAHGGWASYPFALAAYSIGSVLCHQLPERSFHMWAVQLPVCARCTGVYLGAAVAAAVGVTGRHVSRPVAALMAGGAPAAATLVYQWATGDPLSNWARAATGVLLGGAVMAVLLAEMREGR
jgi:Predicted membrane protein (DUF2085)